MRKGRLLVKERSSSLRVHEEEFCYRASRLLYIWKKSGGKGQSEENFRREATGSKGEEGGPKPLGQEGGEFQLGGGGL